MGSGRGGLHHGTWGSREGEALRVRVNDVLRQFGGSVAGDAAAELAEALVRVASGESSDEIVPEPGEVAFDLALDVLSPFIPGGGRVTRELAAAARRKGPSPAYFKALEKGLVSEKTIEQNAEFANELFKIDDAGLFGEKGQKGVRLIRSPDPASDSLELFERLSRGAKSDLDGAPEGITMRWLQGGTTVTHRNFTSTPESPAVQISYSTTGKLQDQKIHFLKE